MLGVRYVGGGGGAAGLRLEGSRVQDLGLADLGLYERRR